MTKRTVLSDKDTRATDVTSAGVPWSEVPEHALHSVEWVDGRHGSAEQELSSSVDLPIPAALHELPFLHKQRPRASRAMIDAHGARSRLANCRPGAWLVSPLTGWKWAKWPNGEVGWVPKDVALPDEFRVLARNDIQ